MSAPWRLLVVLVCVLDGCRCSDQIEDATTRTVGVLDDTSRRLLDASGHWEAIVQDAIDRLTDETQSTVRVELTQLLQRSVAAVGIETRCGVDFIRRRLAQAIRNIADRLLQRDARPLEPYLCDAVPGVIDMSLAPARRNVIDFYGYDFDRSAITVLLQTRTGTVDVSSKLDRPSHYHMTLNLGGTGVQLTEGAERFILKWSDREISSIGVLQATTPICRTRTEAKEPNAIEYIPPKVRGDRDFSGHGPAVTCQVELVNHTSRVDAMIAMQAKETESDWTEASGSMSQGIYSPPTGWRVERINMPEISTVISYRDSEWDPLESTCRHASLSIL